MALGARSGLAALALAALPAVASATYPDPYLAHEGGPITGEPTFTVSGGLAAFTTSHTPAIECEATTAHGRFTNEETGVIRFHFTGCETIFELPCTSAGEETGDITTTELPFHLKTVDDGDKQTPGVLITPGDEKVKHDPEGPEETHFASFSCPFVGEVVVGGPSEGDPATGIVGTITDPEKGDPKNTATLSFESAAAGTQKHRTVTNDSEETTEYDLRASIGGSETTTAAQDGEGVLKFADGTEPEILTTEE